MIMDKKLLFASALDVSAAVGTATVGDVIDLDTTDRRLFSNNNLKLAIGVTVAFTTGTTATVQFQLASDASAAIATDGTQTIHVAGDVYDTGELTVGKMLYLPIPPGKFERYLGLQVVTAGDATTAGSINAGLVMNIQDWEAMADAQN